jgi:membrane protein
MAYAMGRAIKEAVVDHDAIELSGYLAYLSMLALFPFLVLVVTVLGYVGEGAVGAAFIQRVLEQLPPQAVDALRPRIAEISAGPPEGLVTLSIIGAIWTASSAVEGLRTVLNRAYHVSTPPAYVFRRLLSIVQLLIFATIVITGLLLMVFAPIILQKLQQMLGIPMHPEETLQLSNVLFSFSAVLMFIVVVNLYYILPNIRQGLRDVVPGACITVALWIGAAKAYSYYLSTFNQVNLIYGSLGGIIASLIFFFIINLCIILGAEVNYQLAAAFGTKLEEKEHVEEEMEA